ncbi:hypothetical protein, partial [Parasynechococcus sp.]|uniref:hypothetical protein n=1 Tax=Parasynechococcus sp. TaxID=3101203 RepID=UPI003704066D
MPPQTQTTDKEQPTAIRDGKRAQKNHLFAEVVSSFNGAVLSSDGSCSVDDLKMFYLAPSYFLRG